MSKQSITLYWLPYCTTCQKAARYLDEKGFEVTAFRDIKSEPLNVSEITKLAKLVGSADELFSRRARKYREMNLQERELSSDEMIRLMTNEYSFLKRPVLVCSKGAIAGFAPKEYDRILVNE